MGSVMNGMAVSGTLPFGGTFFVFSDYMRPAVRAAAIQRAKVAFVWTHDSIGVGEDGPTHQPVEQLAAIRAIPTCGSSVLPTPTKSLMHGVCTSTVTGHRNRAGPADGSGGRRHRRTGAGRCAQGAYVLADEPAPEIDLVLIGTGSEVDIWCTGARRSRMKGCRCGSSRCRSWDLFEAQPGAVRPRVLPPGVPTLAVEAAVSFGVVGEGRRRRMPSTVYRRVQARRCRSRTRKATRPSMLPTGHALLGLADPHPRCRSRRHRDHSPVKQSPIARLPEFGQSPWYDNLTSMRRRPARRWNATAVRCVTSNPTITRRRWPRAATTTSSSPLSPARNRKRRTVHWELVTFNIANTANLRGAAGDQLARRRRASCRSRSIPTSHTTTAGHREAGRRAVLEGSADPTWMIKIPGTTEVPPRRSRRRSRGHQRERHADLRSEPACRSDRSRT